ncbi:MAG: polysaccharide deacetylase family protein [Polyangiaceae bacterium]
MRARTGAVSVDLDEVREYTRIHDLPPFGEGDPTGRAVYERALDRIEAWAASLSIPITFFAVGRDLDRPENGARLRRLVGLGHAVECHSLSHRYDLSRMRGAELEREVTGGLDAIERATSVRPTGFRAPGYTVSEPLFDALAAAGVAFDSSVFPSLVYHTAKAAVMAVMRVRGRESASILGSPRVLGAPRGPYRPGADWHSPTRAGGPSRPFVELPVQVTPIVGFPVIGTSLGRAGAFGVKALALACAKDPFVNLELHGMDFLAADDIAPHPLTRLQPELGAPLQTRLDRLTLFVETLRSQGISFVTLAEAARRFARSG